MSEDEYRGKFLTKLRLEKNLKQTDLAKMIGYSDKSISKWERGKCYPKDTDTLIKLANIFDVSIDELLQGEYSDIEGKNTPRFKNKYLNFILKNRIIFIIVFILIILMFFIYYFIIDFDSSYKKIFLDNVEVDEISDISIDDFEYKNDNKDSDKIYSVVKNRPNKNNKYDRLLDEGFKYENFIYFKEINDSILIEYLLTNDSIKVYIYLENDELIVLHNSKYFDDVVVEKYFNGKHEIEYIKSDEIKNCNIEKCESYLDYAMYINYIKNLILK